MQYLKTILALVLLMATTSVYAQTVVHGKIIDATTGLPIEGASIKCTMEDCDCGCTSDNPGQLQVKCTDCRNLAITSIGYSDYLLTVSANCHISGVNSECSAFWRPATRTSTAPQSR